MSKVLPVVLFYLAWLGISGLIYVFVVRRWVRTEHFGAHGAYGLLGAVFLAPGLIAGHGVAPFPGGAAFLLMVFQLGLEPLILFNLASWLVTAAVLAPLGRWLVRRKNAEEARIASLWDDVRQESN
jgi:hypothetical protein